MVHYCVVMTLMGATLVSITIGILGLIMKLIIASKLFMLQRVNNNAKKYLKTEKTLTPQGIQIIILNFVRLIFS